MTLRVAVNLLWLVPGGVGGTESYATRLLAGVAALDPPDVEVTLFALPGFTDAHPALARRFEVETAPLGGERRPVRVAMEASWLATRTRGADVVHHLGGTMPVIAPGRTVLTIHDLQYLVHPEWFSPLKRRYLAAVVPRSVARADLVTVVSEPVADHVRRELGVGAARLAVVPHAVPELPSDGPLPPDLPERYVVLPARTYPHKNHDVLFDALERLPEADRPHLVLTGGAGRHQEAVAERAASPALAGHVHLLGQIDEAALGAVLGRSRGLVFPSRFEGFGAPVVEAMALGIPVVASTADPLPELVAGAGRLLDPDDVDGWARAMTELVGDDPLPDIDLAVGLGRARLHRPVSVAERLVAAWRRGLHRAPPGR